MIMDELTVGPDSRLSAWEEEGSFTKDGGGM
jgi:hypothetical protein